MRSFFLSRQQRWREHTQEEKMREVRTDPETGRDHALRQKYNERRFQKFKEDRADDQQKDQAELHHEDLKSNWD